MSQVAELDQARVDAFSTNVLKALNGGAMGLMLSVGHRTGLFDAMASMEPATSSEIAEKAGLQERYVREWLGGLVAARVVEAEGATGRYHLPAEHAAVLTRAAAPNNMAAFAQYIGLLGSVEDAIVDCFRNGGGVPYEKFSRFHEVMAEDSGQTVLPAIEDHILPLVPGLVERLQRGIRVLDAGCGRGLALLKMAALFPNSRFTGVDLSEEATAFGREEAARRGLTNVTFEARDLSTFDRDAEPGAFDLVTTFDAIHDQARPQALLGGIARSLAPDGVYLAQDIKASSHHHENVDHPLGPFLYTVSCFHCMTVSLAQGGEGLGAMWGRQTATKLMREAGFKDVQVHELAHDIQNDYFVCRR